MEEEDSMPWIEHSPGRPALYDQRRKMWGFHVLHMTGDSRGMKGSREHYVFHRFMYTIDSIIGYTMLLIRVLLAAVALGIFIWIGIHLR